MKSTNPTIDPPRFLDGLRVHHRDDEEQLCSRRVRSDVWCGRLDVAPLERRPALSRSIARSDLETGAVQVLWTSSLAGAWARHEHDIVRASGWLRDAGLAHDLGTTDAELMACCGAHFHHDANRYGGKAFCNLFLSEDQGQDVYFPATGQRIALQPGTIMVFDTGNPHGVVARGTSRFEPRDFPVEERCVQIFASWELPIRVFQSDFDKVDPADVHGVPGAWLDDAPMRVCPTTGRFLRPDEPQDST